MHDNARRWRRSKTPAFRPDQSWVWLIFAEQFVEKAETGS
jgi:hypothetical protein